MLLLYIDRFVNDEVDVGNNESHSLMAGCFGFAILRVHQLRLSASHGLAKAWSRETRHMGWAEFEIAFRVAGHWS